MDRRLLANPKLGNMNGWQDLHNNAAKNFGIVAPSLHGLKPSARASRRFEFAMVTMLDGWLGYADIYKDQYDSLIGDDGVLGPEWESIGQALLGMLNGALGRLDGGTLDGAIRKALADNGCEDE